MEVKHSDNGKAGQFFIEVDRKIEARMTYVYSDKKRMVIEHTIVNDSLRGQGVARKLLDAMVDYLRDNHFRAIPQCPYAKSVFDKNEKELADVRA